MASAIPEFGKTTATDYVLRPGGYTIIVGAEGDIAVVSTPSGLALPGGGQNDGESPEEAAVREVEEECGLRISLGKCVSVADEFVFAVEDQTHYRKRCTFFLAKVIEKSGAGESDHILIWLSPRCAALTLRHESQRWAVLEAIRQVGI